MQTSPPIGSQQMEGWTNEEARQNADRGDVTVKYILSRHDTSSESETTVDGTTRQFLRRMPVLGDQGNIYKTLNVNNGYCVPCLFSCFKTENFCHSFIKQEKP